MLNFFNRRKINRRVYERPTLYRLKRSLLDWLKLSGMVVVLAAVLAGSYQFFGRSDFFRLKRVDLSGDLDSGERERFSRLSKIPEGKNLFFINLFKISRNLKRDPEVLEVRLRRSFPDGLTVEIVKHKGVALLEVEGKERYLLSREGVLFKKVPGTESTPLPVIRGFEKKRLEQFAHFYRPKIREAVSALIDFSERATARSLLVLSLDYDLTGGITFVLAEKEKAGRRCTLFFGPGDRDSKFEAWENFFDTMKREKVWYTRLDLHVPGRVFARAEKKN